ncbi:MAG: 50S ribosomal protein L11 methyltransferase [Actinomycetes bacterium]
MTRTRYTRYTLRLKPVAAAAQAAAAAEAQPVDDWSGAAAYVRGPDPAALDYAHPEAVDIIGALQPAGWQEADGGDTLTFWLTEGAEANAPAASALARLGALGAFEVSRERPGWEDAWRRFHTPRVVGRLYVRPPWSPARDDLLDVVVEAGRAFGTGGHATTRQCLEEIQSIPQGSLLDLGCGSGVVSLAALRLGFAPVCGIDIDPIAVHAAAGNAALNGLAPTFFEGDATDPRCELPVADTAVANLALAPILRLARRFAPGADGGARAPRPAHLLLAGLLVEQGEQAAAAYPGYRAARRRDDGTWLMLHLTSVA